MSRKSLWLEATEAASTVPGFELRPRGRKYQLKCVDRDCTWPRPGVERWHSPLRKHAAELPSFARAHANRHHPNAPERAE